MTTPWLVSTARPDLLVELGATLGEARLEPPHVAVVEEMGRLLSEGSVRRHPTAPLASSTAVLQDLEWYRLAEAASGCDPFVSAARAAAAWTALAVAGREVAFILGAGAGAAPGVAVGLPVGTAPSWLSDHAPDLLWTRGADVVSELLDLPQPSERVIHPRSVAPRDGDRSQRGVVAGMERMLTLPFDRWWVVFRLQPVGPDDVLHAQRGVLGMEQEVGRRLTATESLTPTRTSTYEDRRVKGMLQAFAAWKDTLHACATQRGWWCHAHILSASAADLEGVTAAARSLLGDSAAGLSGNAVQEWDLQPTRTASTTGPLRGWLSSSDLGALLVPPAHAVGDLQVRSPLPAGRRRRTTTRPLRLGTWLGTPTPATLDVDDMAGHVFISGITGSGKSTTTRQLLADLWNEHDIPFLVIDPAKSDYEDLAPPYLKDRLHVVSGESIAMNILSPWPGQPLERHVSRVSAAFRGSFSMPTPVPYVATMLFEQLASDAVAGAITLHDAVGRLDALVAKLGYDGEIEANIKASLGLRLRLLLQPGRAERVAGAGPPTWLVDRPTVVQLGDLGDDEERGFLTAMLVLYTADAARQRGRSSSVHHVTVIEEAHRVMPETGPPTSSDEGDAGAVASRLMSQLLAEIRGYGEAVVIVDQSPAAVAREVLRNTSTKLAHRAVDVADQQTIGGAVGLSDDERGVLGSLSPGRCLVSTRSLLRPQVADVPEHLVATRRPSSGVTPVPRGDRRAGARCHDVVHASVHHLSESCGPRAELAVGLWVSSGDGTDLDDLLAPIELEVPGVRKECLVSIGVRRFTATLRRIGHLAPDDSAAFTGALLDAYARTAPLPQHPGAGRRGPFDGCQLCTHQCTPRAVVAAGNLPRQRGVMSNLLGSGPAADLVADVHIVSKDMANELNLVVARDLADAIALCWAVHTAAHSGTQNELVKRYVRKDHS